MDIPGRIGFWIVDDGVVVVTHPGNIFAKIEFDEFEAVGTGPVFGFTLYIVDVFGDGLAVPNFTHVVQFEVRDTIVVKMLHVRIGENLKKAGQHLSDCCGVLLQILGKTVSEAEEEQEG